MPHAERLLADALYLSADAFTVHEAPWWVAFILLAGAALLALILFLILRRTLGKPGPRR